MSFWDFFSSDKKQDLEKGLEKTKEGFFSKITKAIAGKTKIDEEVLDEIESALISADVSLNTTIKIIDRLEIKVSAEKYTTEKELIQILKNEMQLILNENGSDDLSSIIPNSSAKPYVIMVIGVNGVGKTTTIGKLANQFKKEGKSVLLGAGDTFRAAAVNQLKIWGERSDVPVIEKGQDADPSSVAFDALNSAIARNTDIVIIDTAGRLHNKSNLMAELSKIKRVMSKVIPDAPHEVLLVLDATTGQNALSQAKEFSSVTEVNAIALTKLDGTAKGGIVFSIPIYLIGNLN